MSLVLEVWPGLTLMEISIGLISGDGRLLIAISDASGAGEGAAEVRSVELVAR